MKIDHGVATVTVKKFRDGGGEPTSLEEVWHTVGAKGDKAAVRAVAATLKAACEVLAAEPPAEDPAKVSMKNVVECSTAAFVMKFSQLLRAPYGARKRKAEEGCRARRRRRRSRSTSASRSASASSTSRATSSRARR